VELNRSTRREWNGWNHLEYRYPRYERELENLLDSSVIGDPEKLLRHVSKSTRNLSQALKAQGV
jgi:hypothetical protein